MSTYTVYIHRLAAMEQILTRHYYETNPRDYIHPSPHHKDVKV